MRRLRLIHSPILSREAASHSLALVSKALASLALRAHTSASAAQRRLHLMYGPRRPTQDRCTACSRQPTPSKPRLSVWLGLNTVIRCLHRLSAAAGRVRAALQRGCSLSPHRMEARQGGAPSLEAAPLAMLARSAGAQEPDGDAPGAHSSGAEVAPVVGQAVQRLPCLDATHPRGCSTCGPPARHHGSSGVDAAAAMARDTRGCVLAGSLTRRGFAASQVLPAPVTRLGSAVRASWRLWP